MFCFFFLNFNFFRSAAVRNVAGLSHSFPISLNKNEINVAVVNKPVYVDFSSMVIKEFNKVRTSRVPFLEI